MHGRYKHYSFKITRTMKKLIIAVSILFVCAQVNAQEDFYAEVNDLEIYYKVYGEGSPLLTLHGFTGSHGWWDEWINHFSSEYKLILPDLRGHGHSTNPSNRFTHRKSANDMLKLMDVLQIDNFKAIGFSSGAMTLTHMAVLDTTRIKSMVLIGSTSYFPEQTREIQRSTSYETQSEGRLNDLKQRHPGGESQIRLLLDQFKKMAHAYEDMNFTPPYLSSITTPTLIIHGDRDPFFPVDIPVTSFESMPNSYLWILPNFGHSFINKDSIWADAFKSTVNQFFSGDWSE